MSRSTGRGQHRATTFVGLQGLVGAGFCDMAVGLYNNVGNYSTVVTDTVFLDGQPFCPKRKPFLRPRLTMSPPEAVGNALRNGET
jgi:hypothetical protein